MHVLIVITNALPTDQSKITPSMTKLYHVGPAHRTNIDCHPKHWISNDSRNTSILMMPSQNKQSLESIER